MERNDIKIGDIVNVPKGASEVLHSFKGTVTDIYPHFIIIKPDELPYKVTIANCDIGKLKLIMHKINEKTEREFECILNELS